MRTLLKIAALATLAPAAAHAQAWGAVGWGPGGWTGYSYNYGSEQGAYNGAADGCSYNCTVIRTFYNACGAIAVGEDGSWGWAYAGDRYSAENAAIGYCLDYGYNCSVVVWACSG